MNNDVKVSGKTRFAYLDNVRSFVIFLVIAMHAAVTYSGMGGWYYVEGSADNLSMLEFILFGFFQSFGQAWFMGILFFISAFLATKSLARRGISGFIKERLFRLGLPLLIYVFVISPFNMFILLNYYPENTFVENYIRHITDFGWLSSTGPLWFVQVLLIFCIIYAIVKKYILKPVKIQNVSSRIIISAIIVTTVIAFLIRLYFPIGTSFFNLQFCYFASYIVLFISGIIIGENGLWENITDKKNNKWFILTLLTAMPLWAVIMTFGGAAQEGLTNFNGGFHWQSFAFSLWESFVAISFSIGIIAFFRKKVNIDNKFTNLMRDNAFGIYCFHSPILIAVSLAFKQLSLNLSLKFAIVTLLASIFCLIFSFLLRKIKPVGVLYK
jgi:surface polysaccharide O-acyltransferase-like enzyme